MKAPSRYILDPAFDSLEVVVSEAASLRPKLAPHCDCLKSNLAYQPSLLANASKFGIDDAFTLVPVTPRAGRDTCPFCNYTVYMKSMS